MNLTSPIAVKIAELPGDGVTALLKMAGTSTGLFDDSPDGGLGIVMSGLAGVVAALAVAILISIYLRTGYRSTRDIVKHGLATALVLALIAFALYDLGHAALAYLGIDPSQPSAVFEIRLPRAALTAISDTRIAPHMASTTDLRSAAVRFER